MSAGRWLKGTVRALGGTEFFSSFGAVSALFDDFLPKIAVFELKDGVFALMNGDSALMNGVYESIPVDFHLTNGVCWVDFVKSHGDFGVFEGEFGESQVVFGVSRVEIGDFEGVFIEFKGVFVNSDGEFGNTEGEFKDSEGGFGVCGHGFGRGNWVSLDFLSPDFPLQ